MIMGMCIGCSPYNAEQTVITQAIAVLRRFGTDAHVYLPGVGMLNGLQAGNYLDSAGTTQGTVDQPVGLVLDAAGSLGAELVVNGALNDASGWGLGTGWVISGGVAVKTAGTGSLLTNTSGTATTANKTYLVECDVSGCTAGSIQFDTSGVTSALSASGFNGRYTSVVGPTSGTSVPKIWATTTFNGTVDNISVREVTGIHASQPTTASKPILRRGAVNLLTYSGDFSNAAWNKSNVTFSGQKMVENAGTGVKNANRGGSTDALVVGSTYTFAARVKSVERSIVFLQGLITFAKSYFDLSTGQVSSSGAGNTSSITPVGDGSYIVVASFTCDSTNNSVRAVGVAQTSGIENYTGDGSSGVMLYASGVFQGTYTAAQIQALGGIPLTTTAPASTALGSQYWQFDGSNDSLSLGGPLFQMGDDMWVVAGARCERATANNIIFDTRDSVALGIAGRITYTATGAVAGNWRDDAGVVANITSTSNLLNSANVVALTKQGNAKKLYVNGIQEGGTSNLVLGSGTLSSSRIGSDATASVFHQGAIYPIASGKGLITEAELLLITKLIGQLSGVQI